MAMGVILQFSQEEEAKALSILLRHSPGALLPNRVYVVDRSVLPALLDAGIAFQEIMPPGSAPRLEEATAGERI
jgi:hypothetical protein